MCSLQYTHTQINMHTSEHEDTLCTLSLCCTNLLSRRGDSAAMCVCMCVCVCVCVHILSYVLRYKVSFHLFVLITAHMLVYKWPFETNCCFSFLFCCCCASHFNRGKTITKRPIGRFTTHDTQSFTKQQVLDFLTEVDNASFTLDPLLSPPPAATP